MEGIEGVELVAVYNRTAEKGGCGGRKIWRAKCVYTAVELIVK